jgi:hypothetical protein
MAPLRSLKGQQRHIKAAHKEFDWLYGNKRTLGICAGNLGQLARIFREALCARLCCQGARSDVGCPSSCVTSPPKQCSGKAGLGTLSAEQEAEFVLEKGSQNTLTNHRRGCGPHNVDFNPTFAERFANLIVF